MSTDEQRPTPPLIESEDDLVVLASYLRNHFDYVGEDPLPEPSLDVLDAALALEAEGDKVPGAAEDGGGKAGVVEMVDRFLRESSQSELVERSREEPETDVLSPGLAVSVILPTILWLIAQTDIEVKYDKKGGWSGHLRKGSKAPGSLFDLIRKIRELLGGSS